MDVPVVIVIAHRRGHDEAFVVLQQLAGPKLDRDCVAALVDHREEVAEIQDKFREDPNG